MCPAVGDFSPLFLSRKTSPRQQRRNPPPPIHALMQKDFRGEGVADETE